MANKYGKEWVTPLMVTVNFNEYCLMKDGKPVSSWAAEYAFAHLATASSNEFAEKCWRVKPSRFL